MSTRVTISQAGLMQLANLANKAAVAPIAKRVASRVPGARIGVDRRDGTRDWAHHYIGAPKGRGFDGSLARALKG